MLKSDDLSEPQTLFSKKIYIPFKYFIKINLLKYEIFHQKILKIQKIIKFLNQKLNFGSLELAYTGYAKFTSCK